MNKNIPFHYSILRYIPDLVTNEFLNVGLILYSKEFMLFNGQVLMKYSRITSTFPKIDGEFYRNYAYHLQNRINDISERITSNHNKLINDLPKDLNDIINQILPYDDSSLRFSEIFTGITDDINVIFNDLYNRLIEQHLESDNMRADDNDVWCKFSDQFKKHNVLSRLQPTVIKTKDDEIEFNHAWKNGKWNALQPLSFDLATPTYIRRKARTWLGTSMVLANSDELHRIYYLLGKPKSEDLKILAAYDNAKDILVTNHVSSMVQIIEENDAEKFADEISPKVLEETSHN